MSNTKKNAQNAQNAVQAVEPTQNAVQVVEPTQEAVQAVEATQEAVQAVEATQEAVQAVEATQEAVQAVEATQEAVQVVEATQAEEIVVIEKDGIVSLDVDALVNRKMASMVFDIGVTDTEKQEIETAKNQLKSMCTAFYKASSSYVSVCHILYILQQTKAYRHVKNAKTGKSYTDKEFNKGDFTKEFFGIDKTQKDANIQIYKRFFNVYDEETGKRSAVKIGDFSATEFSKTALQALVTLKDDEIKKLDETNIKPDMTVKEIRKEMEKIHTKTNTSNSHKEQKNPCADMTLTAFANYIIECFDAFAKGGDYEARKGTKTSENGVILSKYWTTTLANAVLELKEYAKVNLIDVNSLTDVRKDDKQA